MFTVPGLHWQIGGVFVIAFLSALIGVLFFIYLRITQPPFFKQADPHQGHADPGARRRTCRAG